ncbi:hypothetical protein [Chakrabartyella piscis]|uniref:hypothetical protein n=1 Tax=Chakrabartyella piscis TaxID=2918914 RepID=UPI00295865B9|nr:hypothetical protein [Chakrabartyella piscis]
MKHKKIGSSFLAVLLLLQLIAPSLVLAVETEEVETISISNVEEFLTFAKNCTFDQYSAEKTFVLTADIDLTGSEFQDIPVFLGTFDGDGHTISGLQTDLNKDYQGLFRLIEQGATVKNLSVYGELQSEHNYIAGIAAQNYGTVSNCIFRGMVSGKGYVGGIAAVNTGTISNCTTYGGVFGESQVGGIVGENQGTLFRCTNRSEVNTDLSNFVFAYEGSLIASVGASSTNAGTITDIGGIAGLSDGTVQGCGNLATVGYPHLGYNIGGIVGNQSGYIADCYNWGDVYGWKEVGGIVGQFEPYIDTTYTTSKLEDLREELNSLSDLSSNLIDSADSSGDAVSDQATALKDAVGVSRDHLEELLDQIQAIFDGNIDQLNIISDAVSQLIDDLVPVTDSLEVVFGQMEDAFNELEDGFLNLEDALDAMEDVPEIAEDFGDDMDDALAYMSKAQSALKTAVDIDLGADLASLLDGLSTTITYLKQSASYANSAISSLNKAMTHLDDLPDIVADTLDELEDAMDCFAQASSELSDMADALEETSSLLSDLVDNLDAQEEVEFVKTDDQFDDTKDALSASLDVVSEEMEGMQDAIGDGSDVILDDLESINQQLSTVSDTIIDLIQDVTSFDDKEGIFEITDVSTAFATTATMGKVANCTNRGNIDGDISVGGLVGAMSFEYGLTFAEELFDFEGDKTQTATRNALAIVEDGANYGNVTAKKDGAGGIVGMQEFGLVMTSLSQSRVESVEGDYVGGIAGQSTAIVRDCYSKSRLSGNDSVGGIVGYGLEVYGCYSLSSAVASDGSVGGIAGGIDSEDSVLQANYFVSDVLGGVDGLSYQGKAEPITYQALLEVEGLPSVFGSLSIILYQDEVYLDTITVNYGDSYDGALLPEIVTTDGHYGLWEDVDLTNIQTDIEVHGELIPLSTTLAFHGEDGAISMVLVDGCFTQWEALLVTQAEDGYTLCVEGAYTTISKVRIYNTMGERAYLEQLVDGAWQPLESTVEGLYVTAELSNHDGTPITIRLAEQAPAQFSWWLVGGAVLLLAVTVYGVRKKTSRHKATTS